MAHHASIPSRELLEQFRRSVFRAVVNDKDLDIPRSLLERRFQRVGQVLAVVISRYADGHQRSWHWVSAPTVVVLEPDNIVLSQVASGLHLDEVKRRGPAVFQPVFRACRNKRGLIVAELAHFFAARDSRGP